MNTPTRIAICGDTHFWLDDGHAPNAPPHQMLAHSGHLLAVLMQDIQHANPDYCFHLGDLTCGGGGYGMPEEAFTTSLNAVADAFDALPCRTVLLPGNHDCPQGKDWSLAHTRFGLARGMGRSIDTTQARLVLLNAQGHNTRHIQDALPRDPTYGWVCEEEIARLDHALATTDGRPVILFTHQMLNGWTCDEVPRDTYSTANASDVMECVSRHGNVRAIFQAHAHRLDVQHLDTDGGPCCSVILPAIIEYPMAWLQLDLSGSTLTVRSHVLPVPEIVEASLTNGGDAWREGQPEWQSFSIDLG